jgi:hypothetical protein
MIAKVADELSITTVEVWKVMVLWARPLPQ